MPGLYSRRKYGKEEFICVYSAGSFVPGKRRRANNKAEDVRKMGHKARVETLSDGTVLVWKGPKRKASILKEIKINGKKYKLYGSGSKRHCDLLAGQRRFGGYNARVIRVNDRYAVYVSVKKRRS